MIDLRPSARSALARFARELDAQDVRVCAPPDLSGVSHADREAAFLGWAGRIVDEQGSVAAFTELLTHLVALEAPYAALATVHRIIGDELRHVRLCAEVASWFGELETLEIDLSGLELPEAREGRAARALEIVVRELVVGEAESLLMLRAYRDASTDASVLCAYEVLLFDEARHAAAGRHLDALLRECLPADALAPFVAREAQVRAQDRAHMRAAHLDGARGGPGRAFGVSITEAEARAAIARERLAA